jgi:hypothetical protein
MNLVPDSSSTCRFDPRTVEDLELNVGENVQWSFCNACNADMTVQLDVAGPGPFGNFQLFLPLPSADNLVSTTVPCHDYGQFFGIDAQASGSWKYSMRVGPTGTTAFPDVIDPRLEIDDTTLRNLLQWGGLVLLGGLGGGAFVAWRGRKGRPR